jgi:hypothetical protein
MADTSIPPAQDLIVNGAAKAAGEPWRGGRGSWQTKGTFGGATVTLQAAWFDGPRDTAVWMDMGTDAAVTANAMRIFEAPPGTYLRAVVTGGSPSGLNSRVVSNGGSL